MIIASKLDSGIIETLITNIFDENFSVVDFKELYFNKKYNYIGYLFQYKYSAELIHDDKQMLETSRYINLNSIKAKMVETPTEHK